MGMSRFFIAFLKYDILNNFMDLLVLIEALA
jgi:hypothetical protein